uniref:DNA replication factor Cdt1-like n=1 Tax=Styela clava TaxID=7725 RepID=UPI001939558F|nr:DNA replication factor Cdt1-like [Styela clava]
MSQGVVTNYFSKKRRGGYIQPSKRLKLSNDTPAHKKVPTDLPIIIQAEKFVQEIRQTRRQSTRKKSTASSQPRRSTRNSVKEKPVLSLDDYFNDIPDTEETNENLSLRLSPTSSESGSSICSGISTQSSLKEIVTAANDDHDMPVTPSKRQKTKDNGEELTRREKRGRASPKKAVFDFKVVDKSKLEELKPETDFSTTRSRRKSARKKLLSDEAEDSAQPTKEQSKQSDGPEKTLEKNGTKSKPKPTENIENVKKTRSRKNATSEVAEKTNSMKKTKKLAEKLLAKKKDSPDTLRETLKNSSNLKDLQETLLKIREQKKKQQEKEKAKKIQKKKEPQKEVAISQKREFAYETLHSLAQEVPKGLPLPFKYKILAEMFRCADTVVGMLFNRQQVTTWATLQKSVKDMIRKNFELENLSQIKSVFPSAYEYRQEKGIMSYNDHIKPSDYQLTLEPILDERECDQYGTDSRKLTSGMMVKRRHHFLVQLVNIVKDHHKKFLSTLDPPIEVESDKILRWHPQFPLDRVPDVSQSDLPKPPDHEKERCHSAKDVLEKARSKFTKKAVDALKKVAEKASLTPEKSRHNAVIMEENNNITPKKPQTPVKSAPALKGVSSSLLAKIRAKEAEKKLKTMVRSDNDSRKLQQLIKLPDVARALRMLFVTEKKAALPLEYIADKLDKCCTGILTPAVVQEHVVLLIEHQPTWISRTTVRNICYVRMDKGKEMSDIITALQNKVKEAERA